MAAPSLSLARTFPGSATSVPERAAAVVALCAAAPAIAAVLATVRVLSGQAPLVAHLRVGQFGEPLWVWKVRTMWPAGARARVPGWIEYLQDPALPAEKTKPDPRVTSRFAAFCRRHSIDELPQLIHIAAGHMCWVGPRPMTRTELDQHYSAIRAEILSVPPGLTGLWQVMGRNRLTYAQRCRLDLLLVRRLGWRMRAVVLLKTVREVMLPRYAW